MNRRLQRLLVILALGVAAFLLVTGLASKTEEEPVVRRAGLRAVFPEPGTVAVRQGAVGADLDFGWAGRLQIDGRDIPDDQLDRIQGINRISFMPGAAKEIESLEEGRHCVSLFLWTASAGEQPGERPYEWCFTAA